MTGTTFDEHSLAGAALAEEGAAPQASVRRTAMPAPATPDRLRALVDEHYDFVWGALRRLGLPEPAVDDAAQQVYLVAASRLADIQLGKERVFLFGTAVRVAANARRSIARIREDACDDLTHISEDRPNPEDALSEQQRRALLDEVLDPLPSDLRAIFVLSEFERLTNVEIAEAMEIPVGTVASRLRRARELVEAQIKRVRARLDFKEREQ